MPPQDPTATPPAPPSKTPAEAWIGAALLILVGVFLLDLMAVMIKALSPRYAPGELAVWRNLFGIAPVFLILLLSSDWHAKGRPLRLRRWKLALGRGLFVTFSQVCYYFALARLEFATAATLAFAGPLFVVALSATLLREPVGVWRWGAVIAGFLGVALVMRPGSDVFVWAAVLPLGAALGYATASVTSRMVDPEAPTSLVILYSAGAALVGAVVFALLTDGFTAPHSFADVALIVAMGTSGGVGVVCLVGAYRLASPPTLAPLEYFGILYAFLLGWLIFDEAPVDRLFPGVLLIVGAGLVIAWRQRVHGAR